MPSLHETLHKLPFVSQELVDTLDWAWLVDFGQGNFLEAKEKTEIALEKEKSTSNLLARAIVHQLQGEYNQALFLLENIYDIETEVQKKFLTATIAFLVQRKIRDNLADGFSISPHQSKTDRDWQQKIKFIKLEVHSLEYRLIINYIQQIASILPCWRTALQQNQKTDAKYQNLIWQKLTEQLELYQQQNCHAIASFFYCSFADLLSISGQFITGWQIIEKLAFAYQKSAINLETAWYLICQGDLIVETAPFGKALVFGYQLTINQQNFSSLKSLDRSQIDSISAQQKYLEAREYFSKASMPRGEAISIMRLAYLNGVQKQWYLAACGYEEARKIFLEFGDYLNAIAAEMGYLWSFLQYENLENQSLINIEKSIDWMFNNGTINFTISWSMAFTAAAIEALDREEGINISQRLIKISEIIVNKAIKTEILLHSTFNARLWTKCFLFIADYYRNLSIQLVLNNNWDRVFITAEKAKIYSINLSSKLNIISVDLEKKISQLASIDKIARSLPSDTILISFLCNSNQLLGWAITNKGLAKEYFLDGVDKEEFAIKNLEKTINIWFDSLIDSEADRQLDKVLENIFVQPFISEIENHKHLLINKENSLENLSFESLKYHHQPEDNFLRKEAYVIEDKTISYLTSTAELVECFPINFTIKQIHTYHENNNLSLFNSLVFSIEKIYNSNYFEKKKSISIKQQKQTEFDNNKMLIHLFVTEEDNIIDKIAKIKGQKGLVIVSIKKSNKSSFLENEINKIAQKALDLNIKSIVFVFDNKDSLSTAILTFFFHQGLYFGQTVAEAMQQAQNLLRLITAQDALDFCQYLQSHIDWKTNSDRALRALITKHIGDVMILGKNYQRAAEAYKVAIDILYETGYFARAKSLQNNYKMLESLSKVSQPFQSQRLIFKAPAYWNNACIYGNWQLSFTTL